MTLGHGKICGYDFVVVHGHVRIFDGYCGHVGILYSYFGHVKIFGCGKIWWGIDFRSWESFVGKEILAWNE